MQTVYSLGGGSLRPIKNNDLAIGQKVRQADIYEIGTICAVNQYGYTVIFENGEARDSQTTDSASPYTRITPIEPAEIVSEGRVRELLLLRQQKQEEDRRAAGEASKKHAEETQKLVAELHAQYPWAEPSSPTTSNYARAAKNLKRELEIAFPGIRFSVRSSGFSGGNEVRVSWHFGPTTTEVKAIADKYQSGSFDGMNDIYGYDRSAYSSAISIVLGQSKYVFCAREFGGIKEGFDFQTRIAQDVAKLFNQEFHGINDRREGDPHSHLTLNDYVDDALARCNFPRGATYAGVKWNDALENGNGCSAREIIQIVLDVPAATVVAIPTISNVDGITVTENEEKDGVEIRFPGKPTEDIRAALKQMGFRWSRPQSLWYAKRNPSRLKFAQALSQK